MQFILFFISLKYASRPCIIHLSLYELMVEINIIHLALFQLARCKHTIEQ